MKLNLLSCDAQRPDRRAIVACFNEIALETGGMSSDTLMDILLEGDSVMIEVADKNTSSALRALRKLDIDYEVVD